MRPPAALACECLYSRFQSALLAAFLARVAQLIGDLVEMPTTLPCPKRVALLKAGLVLYFYLTLRSHVHAKPERRSTRCCLRNSQEMTAAWRLPRGTYWVNKQFRKFIVLQEGYTGRSSKADPQRGKGTVGVSGSLNKRKSLQVPVTFSFVNLCALSVTHVEAAGFFLLSALFAQALAAAAGAGLRACQFQLHCELA